MSLKKDYDGWEKFKINPREGKIKENFSEKYV